jgi:hypothetical protein
METVKNRLLSVVLFSVAPFFFIPPKGAAFRAVGSDFATSYYHFRQNHRNAVNLALHLVCFFVQIFGNFALLAEVDARLGTERVSGVRTLSLVSAVMWALINFFSSAPKLSSVISAACIALAFVVAPHITPRAMDAGVFGSFLLMLVLSNMATGIVAMGDMVKTFVGLPLLVGAAQFAEEHYFMAKAEQRQQILGACVAYVIALPLLLRNPLKPLVVTGVFVLRAAYVLTGDKALFFLGYGFLASLLQGVTHIISREEATLIALERKSDRAKISFEFGHVVLFPNLAVTGLLDAVRGIPPPAKPADYDEKKE